VRTIATGSEPGAVAPRSAEAPAAPRVERRRYFRVWTRLVLRHRRVTPDERERIEAELRSRTPDPPWTGDPALGHWLARIESKLDRLLERLEAGRGPGSEFEGVELRRVEISGSGLRFACAGALAPGDDVLVEIWIPGAAARRVRSLARVVRNVEPERPGASPSVALAFRVLAEEDRDAIVRHSLEVQRLERRAGVEDARR
jgi:hypothetical protein